LRDNLHSEASQLLIDYLYSTATLQDNRIKFLAGNHLACSADKFRELNGFDPIFVHSVAEDRDFCRRWIESGKEILFVPEAIVYHAHNLLALPYFRQHFRYGRGAFTFHTLEARRHNGGLRFESVAFYLNLIAYPIKANCRRPLTLSYLLALSQVANTAGFVFQMLEDLVLSPAAQRKAFELGSAEYKSQALIGQPYGG
jgi:GT2 family glycosyltransferase